MQRAGLDRIEQAVGRQFYRKGSIPSFDAESYSIFDEQPKPPKRWSDSEVYAWRDFRHCNLRQDSKMPAALEDVMAYPNVLRTLFIENRKCGTVSAISAMNRATGRIKPRAERYEDENPVLFQGPYTGHHPDERLMLVKGYDSKGYYKFIQDMLEAYFNLDENTLVPEQGVYILGELVPMCTRLVWAERGISFLVECENKLYDVEDDVKFNGKDKWFNFYARWTIKTTVIY
jgi:hypothetical protein